MITAEDLARLLPTVHRLRDVAAFGAPGESGPLHDLLAVLAGQADVVDADLDRLADAWFIETCADWLVPYLGDLLGATPLHPIGTGATVPRTAVANTLTYRQRKGTLAVLEQLTRDVTGWPARAVEAFSLLAWNQAVNHIRPKRTGTPDLHPPEVADRIGGPLDRAPRTVEVRGPARGGRYGLDRVVLFLYRLQHLTTEHAEAVPAPGGTGRWHLDPFERDVPLFRAPTERPGIGLSTEEELPVPLHRRDLPDPGMQIETAGLTGWTSARVVHCDLTDWRPPPEEAVAVDPVLGRATTGPSVPALRATVTTGTAMPLGGGPYDRRIRPLLPGGPAEARLLVGRELVPAPGVFTSVADALASWRTGGAADRTDIVIVDNAVYDEPLLPDGEALDLHPGQVLRLVAADDMAPATGELPSPDPPLDRTRRRAVIAAPLTVRGNSGNSGRAAGHLALDGLWCTGPVTVAPGDLAALTLQDCTVAPQHEAGEDLPAVRVAGTDDDNPDLAVELRWSVAGDVHLGQSRGSLRLDTVLLHGGISAQLAEVTVCDSTVDGPLTCDLLTLGSSSVFTGPVTATRRQAGCLRYCWLPEGSLTPPRYRCQPDLALAAATDPATGLVPPDRAATIRARVRPSFTSLAFRHPAAGQLARRCPSEIAEGTEDGTEMGVHRALRQPQRWENLAISLDEYLPAGLQVAVVTVT
ncbi:hypothetical protein SAMN05660350_00443 [Geodermatophilus obscurus]|uniref:Phage tail protein (Tail_P2_I) n=1 Tax=Geodermatophilus obscurus TaxID=1861 RepID=A0A1M7S3C7_9ACTN|nr:hypothetical protein [Geodermatophilus obscurus]SHN52950.1 hypothetical protein SAMN05660350_00443 [Geodermatophilus obscurus]